MSGPATGGGTTGPEPDDARAIPKSMMTALSPSIMMLAGLRSRCTTPASCAASSPAATCRMILRASGTASLPLRFRSCRQVLAIEIRHRDVLDAADFAQIVDADDVPMGDLACEQQFLLESALDCLSRKRIVCSLG